VLQRHDEALFFLAGYSNLPASEQTSTMHIHKSCPASTTFCSSRSSQSVPIPPYGYSDVKMGDVITHRTCCRRCRLALVDGRQSSQNPHAAK
jgi:hypothetical protein